MAAESDTEIVLETPTAETEATGQHRALPFSFAKRHGVLIREIASESADTVYRPGASPLSLAEARRFAGVPLKLSRVSAEVFDALDAAIKIVRKSEIASIKFFKRAIVGFEFIDKDCGKLSCDRKMVRKF